MEDNNTEHQEFVNKLLNEQKDAVVDMATKAKDFLPTLIAALNEYGENADKYDIATEDLVEMSKFIDEQLNPLLASAGSIHEAVLGENNG
jgi:hypothetical protein